MDSGSIARRTQLLRPPHGGSARVRIGSFEFVVETVRGGVVLLVLDGKEARKWFLGLSPHDELAVEPTVPQHPLRLVLRDRVALAPGAALHGYVAVPLQPSVLLVRAGKVLGTIAGVQTDALAAEWSDEEGAVVLRTLVNFHHRIPQHADPFAVVAPMVLHNHSEAMIHPTELPLRLRSEDLRELRKRLIAAPRRLQCADGSAWSETVRPWRTGVAT
ncbi:MAG: hypothetical protein RL148_3156 [Planctomycetota bacterium]|jgi:hypothetical protein